MSESHSSDPADTACSFSQVDRDFENLKAGFITSISHEVRTPLSIIFLSVEMLKLHGEDCTQAQREAYLDQIYQAAKEINRRFNEALPTIDADPA